MYARHHFLDTSQFLEVNDCLMSRTGKVQCILLRSQEIVLRAAGNQDAYWSAGTVDKGVNRLEMRDDGNLVATDPEGQVHWESGTAGNPGARARVDDKGSLQVETPGGTVLFTTNSPRVDAPPRVSFGHRKV